MDGHHSIYDLVNIRLTESSMKGAAQGDMGGTFHHRERDLENIYNELLEWGFIWSRA